jgi:AcrR family transcriptional regulator
MARQDMSNERISQILDTAAVVFARKGFHQARVDDIVQESGLSKGTIYWYFKSKNDIIIALSQRILDHEIDNLQTLLDAEGTVRERLLGYVRYMTDRVYEFAETGVLPILYELYVLAMREEDTRIVIQQYIKNTYAILTTLIQQGIERGELHSSDPETAAMRLAAQYEGCLLLWAVDPQSIRLDEFLHTSLRLHIDSLLANNNHLHTSEGE